MRLLVWAGRSLAVLIFEDEKMVGEFFAETIEDHSGHVIGIAVDPAQAFGLASQ